jgi:hypothetical protein
VKRRRKFVNEISTESLSKVRLLIDLALAAKRTTPTGVLLCRAGLHRDPHTGRGALKMAEVLGLVHASRGQRKALLWETGPPMSWRERDAKLPNLLPMRRLRDLLEYYRGSLIGTPDLVRDSCISNRREALGALKALHVLGYVEIGKLDPQTVAWRWVAGRGESRVYQRGYFDRVEAPVSLEEGPRSTDGTVRWPWIDEVVYREWLLQSSADGFGAVASTDGLARYRPPTAEGRAFLWLVLESVHAMPRLQRAVVELTLLRGLSEREAAQALSVSVTTAYRLSERGLTSLRSDLTEAGFAPSVTSTATAGSTELAEAA